MFCVAAARTFESESSVYTCRGEKNTSKNKNKINIAICDTYHGLGKHKLTYNIMHVCGDHCL